ncbi:nucleotidyltransferase family protein [Rivibacter subsaxonicus]|uniref:MurNAc alpha-1-phosphate uridylyltransferase n=1 Tax=Rivibacter subsaxonicus TaxID=457575 RepID=A0A4Q7VVT8_9BURK|nr:nucleotidyltransferase family protein [Rivibacter subsaxonicus]RZU00615.1 MurNAc alpha-1-phosphate uridylyltransferase [Rivibacter subsaxonicus]
MTAARLPALILAAGRGERLRPHTDHTPKPLLPVRCKPLIEWQLAALARDGVPLAVINTAWLEEQFEPALGSGTRFGLELRYSMEGRAWGGALETAGGLRSAWSLLGEPEACWVVAGDAWLPDFVFDAAAAQRFLASDDEVHLWLIPNPAHHPQGDFLLDAEGRVHLGHTAATQARDASHAAPPAPSPAAAGVASSYTYSTVGLFKFDCVAHLRTGERAALRPVLEAAIARSRVGGSLYRGEWADVGTEQRWRALETSPRAG